MFENYGFCLNELLRASCPPPFGPAELFEFAPGELVRKNLAADLDRSPLIHSYCYASADDQSTLFAIFPLIFVPFMQHAG
jgi:hypothetical protein